ncbi:hypothetical protein SAMD00019534_007990 [Acytostelium subglobosum LB1]|uniref:hypothetical protein n=1 Tax=Acytostelium subglobosum LB1 TaxID=1410327 RepID=UPI000644ED77|nr:hypothetical protein SAMD00019534_007990 [Acytostelium subglobosum LB1]GAM17624.1 hypothetical protein SAMD00019534_007990 [Acytostelium subglobosum LB1]|eukprot:XP_012758220.1 hypothetical protein SAMD00019534_007990 [Acytostelium subglobosum LB1]
MTTKQHHRSPRRYDPFDWEDTMRLFNEPFGNRWMKMFDNGVDNFFSKDFAGGSMRSPRVFWEEKDSNYALKIELPGVHKDDIKVTFVNNKLVIESNKEEKSEQGGTKRHSRSSFYKSMTLPEDANHENINAKMENGLLEIDIPKTTVQESTKKININ